MHVRAEVTPSDRRAGSRTHRAGRTVTTNIPVVRGWLWRPLVAASLLQIAVMATRPTTSYAAIELGADGFMIGVLAAAYAVPPMLGAIPIGKVASNLTRVGLLPVVSALVTVLGCALSALARDLVTLSVGNGLIGLGATGVLIGAQAWISRIAHSASYDQGFGWMTAGMAGGQAIGPLIAGVVIEAHARMFEGTTTVFWMAAGLCVLVGLCFVSPLRVPHPADSAGAPRESTWQIVRRPGALRIIYVSAAVLTSVDILGAYLPLLAEEVGIAPAVVGMMLFVRGATSMASRMLLPMLGRRFGRTALIVGSTALSALTLVVLALAPPEAVMFTVLAIGGFALGIGQPLTMTALAIMVPRRERPRALAVRLLGNRIAQVSMPLAAGGIAAALGAAGVFWLQAVMLVTAAAWVGLARPSPEPDGD